MSDPQPQPSVGASGAARLLNSDEYADMLIICNDQQFPAHRAVVCTTSRFFAAALDGNFEEAKNKVIKLEGSNPTIVKLMLQFMYTSDYDDTPEDLEPNEPRDPITEKTENDFHRVDNNTQVYALADKYEVNGLKALALKKFSALEGIDWGCDEFANLARDIYETTPASDRGLRDVMKDNFTGRYRELSSNPVWLRVIKETPDLCFDLLKGSLDMFFADKDKKASYFEKVLRTLDAACPHCKDFFCYMFKYGFLDDEQQKCTMTCSLCGAKQEVSRD